MKSSRKVRLIDEQLKTAVAEAGIKPRVRIGKIGKSKLTDQVELDETQEGVDQLAPELIEHYQDVGVILADPNKIVWEQEGLVAELSAIAEAILGTGSADKGASHTARRAREVVVLAAGQAMKAFPRTITALVYLTNHAIEIGLLRQPLPGEKGFCVEMPAGDLVQPTWTKLLCPFAKQATLVANFIAMSTEARQTAREEGRDKLMELQPLTRTFLEVFEKGEGKTVCYIPGDEDSPVMYLKITIDNGYITVVDSAGDPFGQTLVGFWIPLESVEKHYFRHGVTQNLEESVIQIMTTIRNCIRKGWLSACAFRERERRRAAKANLKDTAITPAEPLTTATTEE